MLDLVSALREEFRSSVLFISHNLEVITKMCDRVGVLYAGRLVEEGPVHEVFDDARHPYTVGLLRCLPRGGVRKDQQRLDTIPGFLPQLGADLPACVFVDRCALAQDVCSKEEPPFHDLGNGRHSRCHFWEQAHELPRATPEQAAFRPVDQNAEPVIRAEDVSKTFRQEGQDIRAVDDMSFVLRPGETLGLVGESGSGKTTLARTLLGLTPADEGSVIELDGRALAKGITKRGRDDVRALQIVFQNPDSALNRRFSVQRILSRALEKLRGDSSRDREEHLKELAHSVRFDTRLINSRPAQLSGGLKQRVAIARAFAGEPRVVVCDEPTSALDVSVQAAILNLLAELQADKGVTYLFISHDLGVVRYLSDRIAVLYLGRLMELGEAETVFTPAHHPYTEALLSSVPQADGARARADPARGRDPEPRQPAVGLRLPHPLPALHRRHLPSAGARAQGGRAGPLLALPLLGRGPARAAEVRARAAAGRRPAAARGAAASSADGSAGGGVGLPQPAAPSEQPPRRARRTSAEDPRRRPGARRRAAGGHAAGPGAPGAGRGARAPARERRLSLRPQRHRRHRRDALPGGAGPRGRRRGRAGGGRGGAGAGHARRAVLDAGLRGVRGVPARARPPVRAAWREMESGGLLDGRPRLSRDGAPVYHYSFLSAFADRTVVPAACCIPIPDDVPFEVAALAGCAVATGTGRRLADGGRAARASAWPCSAAAASA